MRLSWLTRISWRKLLPSSDQPGNPEPTTAITPSASVNERRVFHESSEVMLTHSEFDLLAFLASNAGKVLSREKILNHVWGYEYPIETRVIDVHIRNLRRKIEQDPSHPFFILAVPGIGYRFTSAGKLG